MSDEAQELTCKVCGVKEKPAFFNDHMFAGMELNLEHREAERKFDLNNWSKTPCVFCGGEVIRHTHMMGPDGDCAYSIECGVCGFLYAED